MSAKAPDASTSKALADCICSAADPSEPSNLNDQFFSPCRTQVELSGQTATRRRERAQRPPINRARPILPPQPPCWAKSGSSPQSHERLAGGMGFQLSARAGTSFHESRAFGLPDWRQRACNVLFRPKKNNASPSPFKIPGTANAQLVSGGHL